MMVFLLFDTICTAVFAAFSVALPFALMYEFVSADDFNKSHFLNASLVYFASAFFTSLWLWIYIIAASLLKFLRSVDGLWRKVSPFLDLETSPLTAVGKIAGLLVGAAFSLLLGAHWFYIHF